MEISPWRCPGNRLDSTSGAATTCIKRFLCRPFTENNRIFSRDKNGSKCWVYGHMMSYDVICMAAFAGLWWFMLISCDINGWCIQILLVVGSTRYRITNSAPNGPAKRWSFWGVNKFDWCPQCVAWYSSYADTAYSHARRVDQTPRAPMDTDWLHPRLGKRKNEDEEVPHASQFSILSWTRIYWTPLMNTFDTRCETIGSSAFHCQDHRELCRMITMVVADEDRRGDASCSCLTWISIHNVFI